MTFEEAVKKLLRWQPMARNIRQTVCHCRNKALMLSYQLPGDETRQRRAGMESCGYFCTGCKFANGGAREIEES